jgi:haloacetate dehalogenase
VFEGFRDEQVDVGDVTLRVRHGGRGPAVVLLHGHPRTSATWWQVAPALADALTVVCPDLPGYGMSSVPESGADHERFSKRAMAADIAGLMDRLGQRTFSVVGHDRGAYVAFRLAMDRPERVTSLVVIDAVPIGEALARADARFATAWWHWFFLGQTAKPAERVINADPDAWYTATAEHMGQEAYCELRAALGDPATVHAMCEDYRAGLGVDRRDDDADRAAGRRVGCPTLLLWTSRDDMAELYGDPLAVWRNWADDVRGGPIESGHHVAEENPEELARRLRDFLGASAGQP